MDELLETLGEFVSLESPSHGAKEESDRCGKFLEKKFSELGFHIDVLPQKNCGDHIYGEIGEGRKSALMVGHYDTVYPVGTIQTMPFKIEDEIAFGPGILDMKGGIIMAYYAVKALLELGAMPESRIGVFFNGDEESGSVDSKDLILEKAGQYQSVLVMEPGVNDQNSIKTGRYGRGTYKVIAHGKAAHSGSNTHLAISPLIEIAKQLLYIDRWDKSITGVTFAPTVIRGGIEGTCMIPEEANFTMDVRYKSDALIRDIHERIMNLEPLTPGIRLEVQGEIDKPIMVADPVLFEKLREIAKDFGIDLNGITIGGGSDGNFTAAAGIPTLDGLGMTGEFLHNPKEYIHIDHIAKRTAALAKLLSEL